MPIDPGLNFDNTEKAFAYKSDRQLKKARFLFSAMQYSPLVKIGTRLTPWAIKSGLPIKGLIKNTFISTVCRR
jgi:proline dehydrogenase